MNLRVGYQFKMPIEGWLEKCILIRHQEAKLWVVKKEAKYEVKSHQGLIPNPNQSNEYVQLGELGFVSLVGCIGLVVFGLVNCVGQFWLGQVS